jgi:hypothetical protein
MSAVGQVRDDSPPPVPAFAGDQKREGPASAVGQLSSGQMSCPQALSNTLVRAKGAFERQRLAGENSLFMTIA